MILGVDIGGTKTLVGTFTASGKLTESIRFETPATYPAFLNEFEKTVKQLKEQKFTACGMAVPGKVDRTEGIARQFGNLKWKNAPLVKDISGIIGCDVYIENDANLAGLSEAHALDPIPKRVLYVTVSTGIGDGVIIDGTVDKSLQDSEAGYMLLPYKGKMEVWQSFASGKAIFNRYKMKASDITDDKVWQEIAHNITLGLLELCAVIEPNVIVIGGGVGTHFKKYGHHIQKELRESLPDFIDRPAIKGAKNAEQAALTGCYVYVKQKLNGRA